MNAPVVLLTFGQPGDPEAVRTKLRFGLFQRQ